MIEPVRPYVRGVVDSIDSLPAERKDKLSRVAEYIAARVADGETAKLVFICTHNSRRSHLSQIWCQTAAAYYGVPRVATYSGGTEATACNIRTIRALRRAGLSAVASTEGENPVYLVQYSELRPPIRAYSKVYSQEGNPTSEFAAMMCCSDADRECPDVAGADGRFPLHYEDPKVADNTPEEAQRYDERSLEIAREMFFLMAEVLRRLGN
ncbi:MAG: protein-tyrosine-phosphatase [Planctomycetota bacterium]|nr:MAG: protein-tyrosine-phosphatase [Planctomycetota bacterium]REK23673.1 MAG: protein-tyrosine-phosphatase [Planctomycetota bacterium]REK31199.1 MAG: protein-tyrosine-phosphatase [Planctomycetota bacterium]